MARSITERMIAGQNLAHFGLVQNSETSDGLTGSTSKGCALDIFAGSFELERRQRQATEKNL